MTLTHLSARHRRRDGGGRPGRRRCRDRRPPGPRRRDGRRRGRARPPPRRHSPGSRRVQRPGHPPLRRPDRPGAGQPRAGHAPPGPGRGRRAAGGLHQLPAAPDPGHRHRSRRARPAHPPGPVGLRLLPVPRRLRGAVQHHLGPDRVHRGQRGHPGGAGQPPRSRRPDLRRGRQRGRRDGAGLGPLLHRRRVPRGRRQPLRARPASGSTSPTTGPGCARRRTST